LFSLSPSPFLRTISTVFILLFSYMNTKYIHHIHPHSPFLHAHPFPLVPTTGRDLFFLPALHFFITSILIYKVCIGTSRLYISCFDQINPFSPHSFSIAMLPLYSTACHTVHCIIFTQTWVVSI
jgi:hypothetical protein